MTLHNLKIAVRNLLKYKTQNIICLVGLAVGLACFTLSSLWGRYEETFDHFHSDAERIYVVATDDAAFGNQRSYITPISLGDYLKNNYTEIEDWCAVQPSNIHIQQGKEMKQFTCLMPESNFIRMMGVEFLEGDESFFTPTEKPSDKIAIHEDMAMKLFGKKDVVGEKITLANTQTEVTIGAVIKGWKGHSNFSSDFMQAPTVNKYPWDLYRYRILIKLKKEVDAEALLEKMNRHFPKEMTETMFSKTGLTRFYLIPITKLRYQEDFVSGKEKVVKSRYINYFRWTGVLIICCALANYLAIYVDRFRTRRREMALRKVCGASEVSLVKLMATEQLITVLIASLLGMVFVEWLLSPFLHYSQITEERSYIYKQSILFMGIMALITFCITIVSVIVLRRGSLQKSLQGKGFNHFFRKGSIIVQLVVSLAFISGTVIMQQQLYHLRHTEVGFEYSNRGAFSLWLNEDMNVWYEKLKALPMIEEVVVPQYYPLVGTGAMTGANMSSWDGQEHALEKPIFFDEIIAGEEFFKFYGIELVSGQWINKDSQARDANITESTAKRLGWTPEEAVGKHIYYHHPGNKPITVVGVVKDCAYESSAKEMPYTLFVNTHQYKGYFWERAFVLFKFRPGTWNECRNRLEQMAKEEAPTKKLFLFSEEEMFEDYLKSEQALGQLIGFASLICILISLFGIYSLVTLTCEQRRKEIAIRKVNGARIGDILRIFFVEYLQMMIIASVVAFPFTYWIMKQWIESYNRQVEIGILTYLIVFVAIAGVITISIIGRVWKAARQNPAEVVKSE